MRQLSNRDRRRAVAADRRRRRLPTLWLVMTVITGLTIPQSSMAATVFSTSFESCKEQCVNRNIAIPLTGGNTSWPEAVLSECDFDCHVESCRAGCQDLESFNSTCEIRCDSTANSAIKRPDSCWQGCRAVADIFLHQIQYLLNRVSVEVIHDSLQGLRLNWTFEDVHAPTLQEISAANIRWVAQTRAAGSCAGPTCTELCAWKWSNLDGKAFKESKLKFAVSVPFEHCSEIQVRLAAIWRDTVVVSETINQPMPLSDTAVPDTGQDPSSNLLRILPYSQLQISADSYLLCWHSEARQREFSAIAGEQPPPRFRLRVYARAENTTVSMVTESTTAATISRQAIRTKFTSATCNLFRALPRENCCEIEIAELGISDGSGSEEDGKSSDGSDDESVTNADHHKSTVIATVSVEIELKNVSGNDESDSQAYIIFTDGRSLFVMYNFDDYIMADDPPTIHFDLADDLSITALASLSTKRLLVGLSDGSIYSVDTSKVTKSLSSRRHKRDDDATKPPPSDSPKADSTTVAADIFPLFAGAGDDTTRNSSTTTFDAPPAIRVRAPDGVAIVQIAVDALQTRLYILRERAGLTRCTSFDDCDTNATTLTTTTNLQNSIQNIAVDSWNGFIYCSTANNDVFVTPLFPADAVGAFSLTITRRLADVPSVFTLSLDLRAQKLIAVLRNGSLWSRDLIDERLADERASVTLSVGYKAVTRSQYFRNRLFWTSKSCGDSHPWDGCLYSEELDSERKSIHLNRYLFGGHVQDFVVMEEPHRPAYLPAPSRLGLLVEGSEARINWKPPRPLPFQASGSNWRSYLYKYTLSSIANVTDDTSTKSAPLSDDKTDGTDIFVALKSAADASKSAGYVAAVRACSRDGTVCSALTKAHSRPTRHDARRSVFVVTGGKAGSGSDPFGRISGFNLLGRELPNDKLSLTAPALSEILSMEAPSLTLAVDNSTGAAYASTRRDISIYRVLDSGIRYRFLDFIAVRFVSVVTGRALIFVASSYTIAAYRLTSSYEKTVYNCMAEDCGEVVGMAADERGADVRVFYFLRRRSGEVELRRLIAFGSEKPEKITVLHEFYSLRQAVLIDDQMIVLTADNQLGVFDTVTLTWNFNLVLRDVFFILGGSETTANNNKLHFKSVEYDSTHGELKWHIDGGNSASDRGHLLYKVELYRENFGGDRIVSLTPHNHFVIPRSVLNTWRSAQPFDVQVDVISPWTVASANRTALLSPSKPPSAPRRLNIYATQQKTVDGTRANIDLLWEEPIEWNGEMLGYLVNCTWDNGTQVISTRVSARRSRAFSFIVKSGRLACVVAAINEQGLVGAFSEPAVIDGSDFRPLIRLFAIDSTDLLVAIQNWTTPSLDSSKSFVPINGAVGQMDGGAGAASAGSTVGDGNAATERRSRFSRVPRQTPNLIQYQTVAFIGNELYAVRKEADALFLVLLDINDISNVLYKGSLVGDFGGQVEAMTSDWVGNRLLLVSNHDFLQISLDTIQQTSMITPRRLFSLSSGAQDAKQLVFDPFTNVAYLLTKNGSLFSLNLNRNGSESNLALELDCLRSQTVTSIVAQFTWNRATSPYIFALTWNGMISINSALLKPNDGLPAGSIVTPSTSDTVTLAADAPTTKSMPPSDAFDGGSGKKCADVGVNWDVFGEKGLKAISSLTVADKLFIFFTSNELLIYDRQSAVVSPVPIANPPLRQILAVSQASQPYPDRSCFALPPSARPNFTVRGEGRTGAVVEINEPATLYGSCAPVSPPQTQYQIQFWRRGTDKVKVKNSYSRVVQIENGVLDKETDYDVLVLWYNRYTGQQNSVGGVFTSPADVTRLPFRTGYGFPTAPIDPSACALTPDTVLLYWKTPHTLNAPSAEIKYKVTQLSSALVSPVPIGVKQLEAEGTNGVGDIFSPTLSDIVSCVRSSCRALIPNLRPAIDYQFWVTALHVSRLNSQLADDTDAVSAEAVVRTKDIPGILRVEETLSDSLTLRWNWLNPQSAPAKISVQYRQSGSDVLWLELRNSSFDPTASAAAIRNVTVGDLQSATAYDYRFVAEYMGTHTYDDVHYTFDELFYQQPQQTRTKAGTPSAPTDVRIEQNPDGWVLQWSPPVSSGGEPVLTYAVEFRPNKDADWEIAERGIPSSRLYWRIGRPWRDGTRGGGNTTPMTPMSDPSDSSKSTRPTTTTAVPPVSDGAPKNPADDEYDSEAARRFGETVAYRVRAANSEGFGAYASTPDDENGSGGAEGSRGAGDAIPMGGVASAWRYLAVILTFSIILVGGILFAFVRQRKLILKHKKDKVNRIINLETIASQIQYPYSHANFPPEVENELRNLPFVRKDAVDRKSLLGRGSFGEVWEGLLTDADSPADAPKMRVAIKYLKHCQDDENRLKFLREAILMNNFDHPNIVKLLGVQRQVEPHFLVIELMEGGDLHSFLNASRPHDGQPSQLCLKELISIMIDIGRGGAYLETFKHVHRDLAARNCLISSKLSAQRVTKIADFGLARDIFSQDYYRVHGSDFLPLRWLSPESAVHGIFTNKSDVWAFGIVLWEIMTLGQQPYPGISNVEVLSCLHEGRPPKRPNECPDEIFAIIKLAWTSDMDKRPTFAELLSRLESLRSKSHLQSIEPFPSLPNAFDSSHGSSSANQQSSTATSCCSAGMSNNVAAGEYFDAAGDFDQPPEAGSGCAAGSVSQTSLNQPATPKYGSRFDRSDNRLTRPAFKYATGGGYLERPESTLSGNTMSTTVDNEYEKPIRSGAGGVDGQPFFHLSRDTSNPILPNHSLHSSDAFANAAFVDDASTSSMRPASLHLTNMGGVEFFNASTPATPKAHGASEQRGRFQRAFIPTPQMEARRGSYQSSPYLQKAARNLSGRPSHSPAGIEDASPMSASSSPYATLNASSNLAPRVGVERDRFRSLDARADAAQAQAIAAVAAEQPADGWTAGEGLRSSRKNDQVWGSGRISHV